MFRFVLLIAALGLTATAATLEKLSTDKMIAQSTEIVRGKVTGVTSSFRGTAGRGGMIYTHYSVSVTERFKGASASKIDVAVPGGTAQGFRQVFAGSPALNQDQEYVLFLWTSRTGLTQIIGLTQGLFTMTLDASGKQVLSRNASTESMLDPETGRAITDTGMKLTVTDLKRRLTVPEAQ
jgi:hypothetical protein